MEETPKSHVLHWFRKGLRLHDNPALKSALDCAHTFRCVYILDPWFLLQCLEDLDSSLRKLNSRLYVVRGQPADVFPKLFKILEEAAGLVRAKSISLDQASQKYGVPKITLQNVVHFKYGGHKVGHKTVLAESEERRIPDWAIHMARIGYGRTHQELTNTVKKILDDDGRTSPFKDNKPGKEWLSGFFRRHPEPMIIFPGKHFSYNPLDGFEEAPLGRPDTSWMDSEEAHGGGTGKKGGGRKEKGKKKNRREQEYKRKLKEEEKIKEKAKTESKHRKLAEEKQKNRNYMNLIVSQMMRCILKEANVMPVKIHPQQKPFGRSRDAAITALAQDVGVKVIAKISHTLYDLQKIIQENNGMPPLTFKRFQTVLSRMNPPPKPEDQITLETIGQCQTPLGLDHDDKYGAWVASFEKPKMTAQSLFPSQTTLSPYLRFG
ncbi:CRY1-like protein, partial [Mya arenaria]